MGAGAERYSGDVLMGGTAGGGSGILSLLPLALEEYGSDAEFKESFHVDEVRHMTDSEGRDVLTAYVREGGSNSKWRSSKRFGKCRIKEGGSENSLVMLNDGGLNTYAYAQVSAIGLRHANLVTATILVKSSPFSRTKEAGIRFTNLRTNDTWHQFGTDSGTAAGKSRQVSVRAENVSGWQAGDTIKAEAYTVNDENAAGERSVLSGSQTFTLEGKAYHMLLRKLNEDVPSGSTPGEDEAEDYVVVYTEEAMSFIEECLEKEAYPNGLYMSPVPMTLHGGKGSTLTEEMFGNVLPEGWYYGLSNKSGRKVNLLVNSNAEGGILGIGYRIPALPDYANVKTSEMSVTEEGDLLATVSYEGYSFSGDKLTTIYLDLQKYETMNSEGSSIAVLGWNTKIQGIMAAMYEIGTNPNNPSQTVITYVDEKEIKVEREKLAEAGAVSGRIRLRAAYVQYSKSGQSPFPRTEYDSQDNEEYLLTET